MRGYICAALCGVILTILGFVLWRRKTRPWKIQYDAGGFTLMKAERKLHPLRAKYKRIAQRVVIGLPSMIAAIVLFFFPVATHLVHPRSQYLKHYRIPIPWTFAVFPSQGAPAEYSYVLALARPFWDGIQLSSQMVFGAIPPDAGTFEFNHGLRESARAGGASTREFRMGGATFTCWQYPNRHHDGDIGPQRWHVDCETPVAMRQKNLYASFVGRERDLPAFYRIIEGIVPAK